MVRREYVYLRTFSGNQALQNKRAQREKETLAARRDDLRGNLSLFWAVSMRQSRPPNVLNMDVCIMKRAELGMTSLNSVFVHQRIQKALWEKH